MSSSRQQGVGRREFLIATSACAIATATIGHRAFAAEVVSAPKRLAVGYAAFETDAILSPASRIPAGDGGFIGRSVRISASGASGAPADARARRTVELIANYSYFDGAERRSAPFRAWGCSRATGCQGSPISFTVPVDDVQKINLTVAIETGAPQGTATRRDALVLESTRSVALPLSLGLQNDAPLKLVRGSYVIVPLFEGDSEPHWSTWTLRQIEGRWSLVDGAGNIAPFEHLVLRIDYAAR